MSTFNYKVLSGDPQELLSLETLNLSDENLISSFNISNSFKRDDHRVDLHIYSLENRLLRTIVDFKDYGVQKSTALGNQERVLEVVLRPERDVVSYGFRNGDVKLLYNFLDNLFSSTVTGGAFFIESISPDRKEIRALSNTVSDVDILNTVNVIKQKFQQAGYYYDFRLNFGGNLLPIAVNIDTVTLPQGRALIIKLYDPLPSGITLKRGFTVEELVSNSLLFSITTEVIPIVEEKSFLRGPNFTVQLEESTPNPTPYYNYNELLSYPVSRSYYEVLSKTSEIGADVSIDYTDFSNFIFFSSAEERIRNFKYKVELLQLYEDSIKLVSTDTGSSLLGRSGSVQYYENLISGLVSNFDHYDRYLYFETGSWAWPKVTNTRPFENAHPTSSLAENWFDTLILSASNYDATNYNSLEGSIPLFIKENPQNQAYKLFVDMIGHHFDNIWIYTKAITDKYDGDNRLTGGISPNLVKDVLQNFGIKLYSSNTTFDDLFSMFTGQFYQTGSEQITNFVKVPLDSANSYLQPVSKENYFNEVYKRIYHNLPLLLKSKGTQRGLRALINCFGIPSSVLSIKTVTGNNRYKLPFYGEFSLSTGSIDSIRIDNTGSIISGSTLSSTVSIYKPQRKYTTDIHTVEVGFSPADNIDDYVKSFDYVSSWSAGEALSTARSTLAGAGTQDAGLAFGGRLGGPSCFTVAFTEEYDGTIWTAGGTLSTARNSLAGAGTQNAGLAFGGRTFPTVACTEEYDGSAWSAGGCLSTARYLLAGAGTQNAGLAFGGRTPSTVAFTEEYDGSAWSSGGALSTARSCLAGAGTQNAGLAFGGTPVVSCTEEYDGSAWSAGVGLITARNGLAGAGTQNAGLAFGGRTPTLLSCTEEYNGTSWTAGGALITARYSLGGAGTQNAGLAFGGLTPSTVAFTEEYSTVLSSTFDIDDYIGDPGQVYSKTYPDLQKKAQDLLGNLDQYDVVDFVRLIKFFDNSLFKTLKDFVPASSNLRTGIIIKPHILERSKHKQTEVKWNKQNNLSSTSSVDYTGTSFHANFIYTGSIDTVFITGSDGGVFDSFISKSTAYDQTILLPTEGAVYKPYHENKAKITGELSGSNITVSDGELNRENSFKKQATILLSFKFRALEDIPPDCRMNFILTFDSTFTSEFPIPRRAYSFRRVNGMYFGDVVTLRRDDNVERNFSFNNLYLDTGAVLEWIGISGSAYVKTIYDQGQDGIPLIQTIPASQPLLVSSGSFLSGSGTLPGFVTDGIDDYIASTNYSSSLGYVFLVTDGSGTLPTVSTATEPAQTGSFLSYEGILRNGWTAGGALSSARNSLAGTGTQDAGLAFGGRTPTIVPHTEEYNGTSWSSGGALSTARYALAGAGTQNAGLAIGGYAPGVVTHTEEYNGTSWSAGGALSTARYGLAGAGTQNAGLAFGGRLGVPSYSTVAFTEEYDGSAWTAGGALITARLHLAGAGTQDAGLAFGGLQAPTVLCCTEEYNGTLWTAGCALITARRSLAGAGTQNAGLAFGGRTPTVVACTEEYDGSAWSSGGALITARSCLAGAGTQNAGLAFGGLTPTIVCCTEEYNLGLTAVIKGGGIIKYSTLDINWENVTNRWNDVTILQGNFQQFSNQLLSTFFSDSCSYGLRLNGQLKTLSTVSGSNSGNWTGYYNGDLVLAGVRDTNPIYRPTSYREVLIYDSTSISSSVAQIENNINNYYNIY